MPSISVRLAIEKDELLRWYAGQARQVTARATDGRQVRFPVDVIRPFVTHRGVHGVFDIQFSEEGRFLSINRLE